MGGGGVILIDVREEDERLFEQIHSAVQGSAMHAGKAAHHCGQGTRVVHDVAAVQEIGVAELLAGEIGGHGDDLCPQPPAPP